LKAIIAELKRRNVFRIAGTYAVVSWIMVQIAAITTTSFGAPDWVMKMLIVTFAIGFPIALVFAWAFEMTPEGVRPTESISAEDSIAIHTGRKLDYAILIGLIIVGALIITSQFLPKPSPSQTPTESNIDISATDSKQIKETMATAEASNTAEFGRLSIAVLPFDDFSPDKDQDYFAKGISEELLNVLARIEGLRVASRTSAFAFQEQDKSVGEIAEALNVAHILEGSIRKAGNTLRITAQLINTSNDQHIWSETYDRPLSAQNIFAVQDEIAAAIVDELKGRLSFTPEGSTGRTVSLEAYELYLQGLEKAKVRLPDPLNEAIQKFESVIALDPNYSQAYSGLADSYMLSYIYGGQERETAQAQALKNIDRALALSSNSAEALSSRAMYAHMFRSGNDVSESIDYAKRAIAANPNYSTAYHRLGQAYATQFDYKESLAAFEKAREFDPLSPTILSSVARLQNLLGDWKAAKATSLDIKKWHPNQPIGYIYLSYFNFTEGNYAEAHSLAKDAQALNPQDTTHPLLLQEIYLKARMFEEALAIKVNEDVFPHAGQNAMARAVVALDTGNVDNITTLIDAIEDDNPADVEDLKKAGMLHYLTGNYTAALPLYKTAIDTQNLKEEDADIDNLLFMARAAVILDQKNDQDARGFRNKLGDYFGDASHDDFDRQVELWAGAILAATSVEPQSAFPWLDRMLDLSQVDIVLKEPAFDRLRGTEEFAEMEQRMEENRDRLHTALEQQRANPKPNWLPF
jgi:TolB-like protein/predicted Zn-dependent protease